MTIAPRYIVAINLVLLAAIAYTGSALVGTAIAAKLMPPPIVHIVEAPPPARPEAKKPPQHYALIQTRDLFNSAKPEAPKPVGPPPKTELKVKLWGIAIHRNGRSSCIIEDLGKRQQELFHEGDTVQGVAKVSRIEWQRVVLTRDGQEEILELLRDSRLPPPGAAVASVAPAVSDEHIQLTGENQYLIDRSEVDGALENMSQLFTQIRAVPHFEGGKSTGFRLFAIRQNSLFDKIGLKNGDIIQKINEVELTDPSRALALFQELRNEGKISVDVLRNKEPKTLSYQLR